MVNCEPFREFLDLSGRNRQDSSEAALRTTKRTGRRAQSIRISFLSAVCALTAFLLAASTLNAVAIPLTPFRYEAQAQRHCPGDTVVWLDFRKEVYYFKHQKHYAQGSTGSFVCRKEARSGGYRRSLLGLR